MTRRSPDRRRPGDDPLDAYLRYGAERPAPARRPSAPPPAPAPDVTRRVLELLSDEELDTIERLYAGAARRQAQVDAWKPT